jgi:hypothetical protein
MSGTMGILLFLGMEYDGEWVGVAGCWVVLIFQYLFILKFCEMRSACITMIFQFGFYPRNARAVVRRAVLEWNV